MYKNHSLINRRWQSAIVIVLGLLIFATIWLVAAVVHGERPTAWRTAVTTDESDQYLPLIGRDVAVDPNPNELPIASFVVDGLLQDGQPIQFDASLSSDSEDIELVYHWAFGDGGLGGGTAEISHIYADSGSFEVLLTVTDSAGGIGRARQTLEIASAPVPTQTVVAVFDVFDVLDQPLADVQISIGETLNTTTDSEGRAYLSDVPAGEALLSAELDGYVMQQVALDLTGFEDLYLPFSMMEAGTTVTLDDVAQGGTATGAEGAQMTLPENALVDAGGSIVQGSIDVTITAVDVGSPEINAFPGGFDGVSPDGNVELIESYGTVNFDLRQGGEPVQLAPGKMSDVRLPLYVTHHGDGSLIGVGDHIPLWSLDESTGFWVQEGHGTVVADSQSPTGLVLDAKVGHFSWWNIDAITQPIFLPQLRPLIPGPPDPNPDPSDPDPSPAPVPPDFPGPITIIPEPIDGRTPQNRPVQLIPTEGGKPVPLPAERDVTIKAYAANGTYYGETVVNGEADTSPEIDIILEPLPAGGGAIGMNDPMTATISPAGDLDVYTFDGTAGQIALLDVEAADDSDLVGYVSVVAPNGSRLTWGTFGPDMSAPGRFQLPDDGTYRIYVKGQENEPGAYTIELTFIDGTTLSVGETISATQVAPEVVDSYYINLIEGQFINAVFETDNIPGGTFMRLYAPDDTLEVNRLMGFLDELELYEVRASGVYRLDIIASDSGANLGDYALTLVETVPVYFSPSVFGYQYEGEISQLGQDAIFVMTDSVPADTTITVDFDALTTSTLRPRVKIVESAADGAVIGSSFLDDIYAFSDEMLSFGGAWGYSAKRDTPAQYAIFIDAPLDRDRGVGLFKLAFDTIEPKDGPIVVAPSDSGCEVSDVGDGIFVDTYSVRGAVRAAEPNQTVWVCPGTYTETETIRMHDAISVTVSGVRDPRSPNAMSSEIHGGGFLVFEIEDSENVILRWLELHNELYSGVHVHDSEDVFMFYNVMQTRAPAVTGSATAEDVTVSFSNITTTNASHGVRLLGDYAKVQRLNLNTDVSGFSNVGIQVEGDFATVWGNNVGSPDVSSGAMAIVIAGDWSRIYENVIDMDGHGIHVRPSSGRLQNVKIYDNELQRADHVISNRYGIFVENTDVAEIFGNSLLMSLDYAAGIRLVRSGGQVENNVIYVRHKKGIWVESYDVGVAALNIINNTIRIGSANDSQGMGIVVENSVSAVGPTIQNNILQDDNPSDFQECAITTDNTAVMSTVILQNLITGFHFPLCGLADDQGTSIIVTGGAGIDGDLRIDWAGSPAIDTGNLAGAPSEDIDGNPRPTGAGVDIGAHEYQGP